jgi:hypothetical protein
MSLVEINWKPSTAELRKTGLILIAGFVVISLALHFVLGKTDVALWALGIGSLLGALMLTGTQLGTWAYWAWMSIAYVMGNVISRVLLALIYFGLFFPLGWFRRTVLGDDSLGLKKRVVESYWSDVPTATTLENAERQF